MSRIITYINSKDIGGNTTGDCWVEEFATEERAIHWINLS